MDGPLKEALRAYTRDACDALSAVITPGSIPTLDQEAWERGHGGHFYRRSRLIPFVPIAYSKHEAVLRALPSHARALEMLQADPVASSHFGNLVGPVQATGRMEARDVLQSLVCAMATDAGALEYSDEKFEAEWTRIVDALDGDTVDCVAISPLPGLNVESAPIVLGPNLAIDRLTDDEVQRCIRAGLFRPFFGSMAFISGDTKVGIRFTASVPKLIQTSGDVSPPLPDTGVFGNRDLFYASLLADDVLTAIRLLKPGKAASPGTVTVGLGWRFGGWMSVSPRLGAALLPATVEVSQSDAAALQELWRTLTSGILNARRFRFVESSLRRFNFAFDRFSPQDRIVDLLIAAESLFLHDVASPQDRGELRFRLSLRASKFVEHPDYPSRELYTLMRRAYDARSAIVHGGEVTDTRLPGNAEASLEQFVDAIEDVIRHGLRKALRLTVGEQRFWESTYWDDLLFPER